MKNPGKIKALILITAFTLNPLRSLACEVCQSNQPKALKGITHGTGPQAELDYIIIWTAVVIVIATLFLSIKYLVRPKENQSNHIKFTAIN